MQSKDASASLKEAILLLEIRHAEEGRLLKEQLFVIHEKLKPINLIKSTFDEITSAVEIKNILINNLVGAISGYLAQKLFVGSKSSFFKRAAGILIKFGVAAVVSRYAETVKTLGLQLISHLLINKSAEDANLVSDKPE